MTITEIKDYLEHYNAKRSLADFKSRNGLTEDPLVQAMTVIDDGLSVLPEDLGTILRMLYKDQKSLRDIAKAFYSSKDTIARKRDKAIDLLANLLQAV